MSEFSITLFKNRLTNFGEKKEYNWPGFVAEFEHQVGQKDGVAFTAGTFAENERKAIKALSRYLVILDVEQITSTETGEIGRQPPSVNELAAKLTAQNMAAVVYTTHSHSPNAPRYRVIFPQMNLLF
jgi:erythromycin esterase-like protein